MSESIERERNLIRQLTATAGNIQFQLSNDSLSSGQRELLEHRLSDTSIQLKHANRRLAREEAKVS